MKDHELGARSGAGDVADGGVELDPRHGCLGRIDFALERRIAEEAGSAVGGRIASADQIAEAAIGYALLGGGRLRRHDRAADIADFADLMIGNAGTAREVAVLNCSAVSMLRAHAGRRVGVAHLPSHAIRDAGRPRGTVAVVFADGVNHDALGPFRAVGERDDLAGLAFCGAELVGVAVDVARIGRGVAEVAGQAVASIEILAGKSAFAAVFGGLENVAVLVRIKFALRELAGATGTEDKGKAEEQSANHHLGHRSPPWSIFGSLFGEFEALHHVSDERIFIQVVESFFINF